MGGFVYIMSNPSYDGRIKIGKSSKDPSQGRIEELSSSTSAPEKFSLEYYCFVDEYDKLERLVHNLLTEFRPNPHREFFKVSVSKAIEEIQKLSKNCGGIKFEEFFLTGKGLERTHVKDADTKLSIDGEESSNKDVFENYPKAKIALDFRPDAADLFNKLKNCPEEARVNFLKLVEEHPDITERELKLRFMDEFESKYIRPFENYLDNHYYQFCLKTSALMANDFLSLASTVKGSVDSASIFEQLCLKHNISLEEMPDIYEEFNAFLNANYMLKANSPELLQLEQYLSHMGFGLKKTEASLFSVFSITRKENMGLHESTIEITERLALVDLLRFLKTEFVPQDKRKLYSKKYALAHASSPQKSNINSAKELNQWDKDAQESNRLSLFGPAFLVFLTLFVLYQVYG